MAAADLRQDLQDNATCSICSEYFKDPVTIDCGHNFCHSCITQCWDRSNPNCPLCGRPSQGRNMRPNTLLGSMVEIARKLQNVIEKPQDGTLCEKHQQMLQLFCLEDQKPICVVCDRSKEHKDHRMVPIEEASEEYKKTLQIHLKAMTQQLEVLQGWATEEVTTASDWEGKYKSQHEKILSAFEELQQLLEQEKQRLLSSLETDMEEQIERFRGKVSELEKQQSSLRNLITEIEGKCQQKDVELLKDMQSILSRCDNANVLKPKDNSAEMEKNLQSFSSQHAYLQEKIKEFKGTQKDEKERESRF